MTEPPPSALQKTFLKRKKTNFIIILIKLISTHLTSCSGSAGPLILLELLGMAAIAIRARWPMLQQQPVNQQSSMSFNTFWKLMQAVLFPPAYITNIWQHFIIVQFRKVFLATWDKSMEQGIKVSTSQYLKTFKTWTTRWGFSLSPRSGLLPV